MINYNNRTFRLIRNSGTGDSSVETVFYYFQKEDRLWAAYEGGEIIQGHLLGKVDENGRIKMTYHHINSKGKILTGKCESNPEIMTNGKIRLHEKWEWTSGSEGSGSSIIEET